MALSDHCRARYEAQTKFPYNSRLIHKATGKIYIMGKQATIYETYLIGLNPMGKGSVSWRRLLADFELDSVNG